MNLSLFLIVGMRRSGNHAIVNWLLPHLRGSIRFLNDHLLSEVIEEKRTWDEARPTYHYLNPAGRPYALVDAGHAELVQKLTEEDVLKQLTPWRRRVVVRANFYGTPAHRSIPYAVKRQADLSVDWNVVGLENFTPEEVARQWKRLSESAKASPISSCPVQVILLMRNPFNHLASMMKELAVWPPNHIAPDDFAPVWNAYTRELCGETAFLKTIGAVTPLYYDRWFMEEAYRRELAEGWGLEFNDSGAQEMSAEGKGSSFEKRTQGDPRQLKVLERWRDFSGNRRYRAILADPELLRLYRAHFGETPFPI